MAVVIRLSRWGAKKKPFYRIVAADQRSPRDGKFIEILGKYDPMVEKDSEQRITLTQERVKYWLSQGALTTDRVARILAEKGLIEKQVFNEQTKKNQPKAKAQEKLKKLAELSKAKEEEPTAE
jgi:small subunit ribosomal protein S16